MLVKAFTASGLVAVSSAHMIMVSPVPYGKSTLNNSPLDASGSDFPCKMRPNAFAVEGASNVFKQGSTQTLAFQGSAVHGGGSCQVSICTDAEPTKDSKWKVIKSIEGGCPASGVAGNAGNNPDQQGKDKYSYTIPAELAAGNYTLAWTWFNKIGNREMYMNCAPLTVEGSGGSEDVLQSLPDMMVANLKSQGDCATKESTDVQFPNPGQDVDRPNGDGALGPPVGSCGGGSGSAPAPSYKRPGPSGPPGSGNGSSGSSSSAYAVPTSTRPSRGYPTGGSPDSGYPNGGSAKNGGGKVPGGVFITVSKSRPTGTGALPGSTGSPQTPTQATPAAAAPKNSTGSAPAGAFAQGTPCTSEGDWNCLGASFQRCASGAWSAVTDMSAGMECNPGQASELKMAATTASHAKRSLRRANRFSA